MRERKFSLEETLQYAKEAKDYAQNQIKKGSSQIENNKLSEEYFDYLNKGLEDIRKNILISKKEKNYGTPDRFLEYYEEIVSTLSKYSLGNCGEMAILALDYVLNNIQSDINAEVYKIDGSDHGFLVLNRDQASNPQDPKTWGDNAVICDPWSDKVYKASEYLSELETFYRREKVNYTENFNPDKHKLIPYDVKFNTNFIRPIRSRGISNLKTIFSKESKYLVEILENYKSGLQAEERRIRKNYGDNDQMTLILSEKIMIIDEAIINTNAYIKDLINKEYRNDYRFAKSELMQGVKLINKKAVGAMQFSKEDQIQLFDHKGQDIKTDIIKFFGIKSTTQSNLEELTKNVNEQLTKKFKGI